MDVKLILLDVDGVLTDGSIIVDGDGLETKRFNVKDGFAINAAAWAGVRVGIISARQSRPTARRARELNIDPVIQGTKDKAADMQQIARQMKIKAAQIAFVGDDIKDIGVMKKVGWPIAVGDAAAEVKAVAKYVTQAPGGRGAVREAIEYLLKGMGRWDDVVTHFGR